ncbi:Sodium/myo-inositol cotransporter [Schistosoma japonicum]|nr:Sodium/myo-inositol cotransporter [Schistosoma japonicum]
MGIKVDFWDISVLILYLICLFSTGLYSLFTHRRGTITDYFLAGRFVTWLPIGASLFASNIGSEHFIGLAGSGSVAGIAVGAFELNVHLDASIILQLLGWVFLPVYIASGVNTLPEYMRNRFGGSRIQIYLAIMSLFLYIFTKISVGGFQGLLTAYGGAIAEVNISSSEGENLLSTMILTAEAKNITSLIQLSSEPTVDSRLKCALPSRKAFKLLREIDDPDMPWLGFLFGQTPSSIWYWCADQMMVQRTLAAKSLSHAQGATLMTGIIKQFPLFIIVIPGMISRVLYPNEIGCFPGSDCLAVCGHRNGCSNMAYPKLVVDLMPSGLRGLMLTVMIAALISDLTSIFNSASTLFTVDVYQKWRSSAQNTELMIYIYALYYGNDVTRSAPPTPNQLHRLTYWTAWNSNKEDGNDEIKHSSGSIDSQLHIVDYLTAPGLVSPIDFKTTVNKPNSRITFKFICLWLCGMENLPCSRFSEMTDKIDESKKLHFMRKEEALTKARLNSITSLHQDPRAKFGLLIGLIGIISLSIFGYIFYSLYFGEIAIGPIPLVGNSTLIQKYSKYITHLQNHNIIKFREK